jgi:hypothetical protein
MAHTPISTVDPDVGFVDRFVRDHTAKPLTDLLAIAAQLLTEDQDLGPLAQHISVDGHGRVGVQLADEQPALTALAIVAQSWGGVITAHPHVDSDGATVIHCEVHFPYHSVQVEAYAFVPHAA